MQEWDALLEAADAADAVIRKYFRKPFGVKIKPDGSKVTTADQNAEKAIMTVLRGHFPEYGFLAEESGATGGQTHRWIIDPLDGTHNFIRGFPFCGPLLAFERDGILQAGVMSLPMLGERVWAVRGKGCFGMARNAEFPRRIRWNAPT
ncbi:hypothetical protein HYV43_04220 [Candidatus Micrarchaeota archaeon]|nr:hypothetical protein [Candidatus Micrarchaeota archaeon]